MVIKDPIHEVEYKREDGEFCPLLEVVIGKSKKRILAYADTGCTSGISLLKGQIKDFDIGQKINDEPIPCIMADGHIIGADVYLSSIKIGTEKKDVAISVIDPSKVMGSTPVEKMTPLLGRDFLDSFDVLFKGKEKKIALFKA